MPVLFMRRLNIISRCQSLYRAKHSQNLPCPCHHAFVFAICRAPGRSQEELAKDICLNKSTVTRALADLQAQGYIVRKPNPADKRELLVYPTEKMTEALPRVRALSQAFHQTLLQGIDEKELAVFASVLSRMEENARAIAYEAKEGAL